jgi:mersacidin/lichenicidin family type 2 lantibiotic
MSRLDIIRAWKDEEYRLSLSPAEQAMLPDNPAGFIELPDVALEEVAGGRTELVLTLGCCGGLTSDTCVCTYTCRCGNWTQELVSCTPGMLTDVEAAY